jgi:membrane-bound lytic murein transglycosylase A
MMRAWNTAAVFLILFACALAYGLFVLFGDRFVDERPDRLTAASFAAIPGWEDDDHAKSFTIFRRSCERIVEVAGARAGNKNTDKPPHPLTEICKAALALGEEVARAAARKFFETHFTPHSYAGDEMAGFVTGYFEPELRGSRTRSDRFSVPVYAVPDDLVQLYPDAERAARNHEMTAGRESPDGLIAYYDRKEIEQGALQGRGLEILYLEDWGQAFYMHIQGSGRVALEQGGHVRLGFAAKNGHSYTAIGKVLIERGAIAPEKMSMDAVRGWLDENPEQARALMWQNRSYIFFREVQGEQAASGPVGAQGVVLSARRSLAVDTSIHDLGTPVWVSAPALDVQGKPSFSQLMIAQDAGSAIKGPQRGDIFFGSGRQAGSIAGATRHKAQFTILLPKIDAPGN